MNFHRILFFVPFESRSGPDEFLGKYTISLIYDNAFSKIISSCTLNTEMGMQSEKSVLQDNYRSYESDSYKIFITECCYVVIYPSLPRYTVDKWAA